MHTGDTKKKKMSYKNCVLSKGYQKQRIAYCSKCKEVIGHFVVVKH